MPATAWGWQITPDELAAWTLNETPDLLILNKPALVVCHPSKRGPWSSLVGACREYLGLDRVYLPFRLDRETSGILLIAKNQPTGSRLQKAMQLRQAEKTYTAILCGELRGSVTVDQPLGRATNSPVHVQQTVVPDGAAAVTEFHPLEHRGGYTLARVHPHTGRMHQIRAHARWLGHPVAADKIYGPDPTLMLDFLEHGFTGRLPELLPLPRQALHASEIVFTTDEGRAVFAAPWTDDLREFWERLPAVTAGP